MAAENKHYAAWILLKHTHELHRFVQNEFLYAYLRTCFILKGRLFNNLSFQGTGT